ncbi:MAG TPA: hypothetical protein VH092_25205 [Urbifossiella sp.]|jgi:hypothetical protein|nr:hypothetical protein [Urbifossiella sp.]
MKFRTRLGLTFLETRDVPDGVPLDPPAPPPGGDAGMYGSGGSIDPGDGPLGGGDTWQAPPPPGP